MCHVVLVEKEDKDNEVKARKERKKVQQVSFGEGIPEVLYALREEGKKWKVGKQRVPQFSLLKVRRVGRKPRKKLVGSL
jgi:hypothetical protein